MEFEDLKKVWKSQANGPSPDEVIEIKAQIIRTLTRRYRTMAAFLMWIFSALSLVTGVVLYIVFVRQHFALQDNWALLLVLAIQWIFAFGFLWQYRLHCRAHSAYADCIANTLRTALDENRLARSRGKRIGLLYLVAVPALMIGVYELRNSGKMTGNESISMMVLFAVALAIGVSWATWQYYRKLLPEKQRLEQLLRDHGSQ